ncbi:unnamed protein product [Didymodactylos carnosus]|uniref:Uncharacterized protein n=1 Tax=Didymodactylos carnosus TaxID=1234261 RepID=A0A815WF80_9BILA|nr:unnamed protein product [Didymodactylos carnosus]CAF4404655.1 unnamed protein product [Didymodactylos carnosus]
MCIYVSHFDGLITSFQPKKNKKRYTCVSTAHNYLDPSASALPHTKIKDPTKIKASKGGLRRIDLRLALLIHADYPEVHSSYGEWIYRECAKRWKGLIPSIDGSSESEKDDEYRPEPDLPILRRDEEDEDVDRSRYKEQKTALVTFLQLSGNHREIWSTLNYNNLTKKSKNTFLSTARSVIKTVLLFLAPNDITDVKRDLFDTKNDSKSCLIDGKFLAVMDGISEAYENSEKWTTRKEILSIVAPKISCKLIQSFLPGLTLYRFTAARPHALEYGTGRQVERAQSTLARFSDFQVEHFIDFILSSHICTDLPFGEQRLRLSTDVELYVPNTIRNMIPSRIVDQYFEYIAEDNPGFPPLGRTSLLSLLNSCKASTRHSLQGVNYFAANASLAFDNLIDMVNDLSLDSGSKKILVDDVKRGRMYMKTDYKVHVQKSSTIADHCINYAL